MVSVVERARGFLECSRRVGDREHSRQDSESRNTIEGKRSSWVRITVTPERDCSGDDEILLVTSWTYAIHRRVGPSGSWVLSVCFSEEVPCHGSMEGLLALLGFL